MFTLLVRRSISELGPNLANPKKTHLSETGISILIFQRVFFSFVGIDYPEGLFDSTFGALEGRNSQKWGNKNLEGHEKVDVSPAG